MNTSQYYMQLALIEAKKSKNLNEIPVGCVITDVNGVIAQAHNNVMHNVDATAHAEIVAIRNACEFLGSHRLDNCSLYTTLEPCAMCAMAISHSRINNIYFGAYDIKSGAIDNGVQLFNNKSIHHKPQTFGGILEDECGEILTSFFSNLRKHGDQQ